jgi:hypothetical protein
MNGPDSRRVGEGDAAKRRRFGVPGGNRAPFGIIREGKPSSLRVDEAKAATVRRACELAAVEQTDWEAAAATGLAKTRVGEVLTNPIYAGRLRTGEPAGLAPIVEPALWSRVQSMRELRRTRTPGRIVKRHYPLRLRRGLPAVSLRGHGPLPPSGADLRRVHRRDARSASPLQVLADRLEVTVGNGRGERSRAAGRRLIRGCTVVMGGERTPIGLDRTA